MIFLGAALAVVVAIGVWFTVRDSEPSANPGPTATTTTTPTSSSSGEPPSTGSPSDEPPTSTAPATTPPATPSAAPSPVTERSREAAKQAGEDWFRAFDWARSTGDTATVKGLSSTACKVCTNLIGSVEAHLSPDVELDPIPFRFNGARVHAYNGQAALIVVEMRWGQMITRSKASGKVTYKSSPPEDVVATIKLAWLADQWQAVDIGTGAPDD